MIVPLEHKTPFADERLPPVADNMIECKLSALPRSFVHLMWIITEKNILSLIVKINQ